MQFSTASILLAFFVLPVLTPRSRMGPTVIIQISVPTTTPGVQQMECTFTFLGATELESFKTPERMRISSLPESNSEPQHLLKSKGYFVMNKLTWLIVMGCQGVFAQGTVYFSNYYGQQVNAPVYESDGTTPVSGSQFIAELFAGPSTNALQMIASTPFMQGPGGAGYFFGGTPAIPTVFPRNPAWVQVDVWNTVFGSTFNLARASGAVDAWWQSSVFSVYTGGETVNPANPGPLTGLGTSPVFLNGAVPEPPTLSLLVLWGFFAWFHCRLQNHSRKL